MIPKVIHYCWFSGEEFTPFIKQCINTWHKVLPDYKLRLWDANSFDFESVPFVHEAYKAKKWAFVTDYIRLYALYTEGGIYMDTDVKVLRSFNEFLGYNFFSAHEKHPFFFTKENELLLNDDKTLKDENSMVEGWAIQAAIMGSVAGLPYLKECLEHYNNLEFNLQSNHINDYVIGKHITKLILKYGYRFSDDKQILQNNTLILPSTLIVGNTMYMDKHPYAIHLCNGSWHEETFDSKLRNSYPGLYKFWSCIKRIYNGIKRRI